MSPRLTPSSSDAPPPWRRTAAPQTGPSSACCEAWRLFVLDVLHGLAAERRAGAATPPAWEEF